MISRPTHPPDDGRGPGDAGTAELAPVIATIEELVEGIARELSASLDPHSLPTQLAARTSDVSSLAQDLDAAGARLRELREQLWYAQAATRTATDAGDQASGRHDTLLARYRDLEPLFMRLESQIRQAQQELHLRDRRDEAQPGRMKSPWLPADSAASPFTKPGERQSADGAVSSVEDGERRRRWLGFAAAAALLIATAVGSWLATRDVGPGSRPAVSPTDQHAAAANPSSSAATSPSTATAEPARPLEPAAIDRPVESSPVATATSGSLAAPATPRSGAESDFAVPARVDAPPPASARTENPVAAPTTTSSSTSSAVAREAVSTTEGRDASRPAEPTESRAAADAVATASPRPLTAAHEDAPTPPAVAPSAAVSQPSETPPTPPAEVIARAATPAPPEDVARIAPPAETARAEAPTDPVSGAEATPLNRPAAVVTRVQPRMMVEMTSADMTTGVELRVRVDRTGRATDVRAVSGPVALRAPAEDTVRRWTFSPALQNGEPVNGELLVTLTFGASPRNLRLPRRSP